MEGFTDIVTGEARRGFVEVVGELEQRFPDPSAIHKEADKKAFAKVFGEYLRIENVLQNFDRRLPCQVDSLKLCIDPAETAQVRLLMRMPQQVFSFPAPGAGVGGCRNQSSHQ